MVTDDTRIRETVPTPKLAIEKGGRLVWPRILAGPKADPTRNIPCSPPQKLEELLGRRLHLRWIASGRALNRRAKRWSMEKFWLLENLRFHAEEEANDEKFSKQLASLADFYVNDAFGTAHRAHASTVGVTKFVKKSAAGLLMEKELAYLGKAVSNPARPFVAILGGAKVSDKIEVVENLMKIADAMLIGGGMAYTFLKAQGLPIGKSLVENDKIDLAKKILADAKSRNFKFLLPTYHVIAPEFKADAATTTCDVTTTPADQMGLDIGPKTFAAYAAEIGKARTIVWNGPMGVFELPAFAKGTLEVAKAVAAATLSSQQLRSLVERFGRSGAPVWGGGANFAYFYWRRRFAGISWRP